MNYFFRILNSIAMLTQLSIAQVDSSRPALRTEVSIDAGVPLAANWLPRSWSYDFSLRAGYGSAALSSGQLQLFVQLDTYHSSQLDYGGLERQVFDRQYHRYELAIYLCSTLWDWLSIGIGTYTQFTDKIRYHNVGLGAVDSSIHVLRTSSDLGLFVLLGFKQDISLGKDFYLPFGLYFHTNNLLSPVLRAGLSKHF